MLFLLPSWRRGLALFALLLGLARLAGAQAPTFDMAVVYGDPQPGGGNTLINSIKTDPQGNTFVGGWFYGNVCFGSNLLSSSDGDVFVAKRTAAGTWLWAARGGGSSEDGCNALAVDAAGQVYVTGYFGSGSRATYVPATFGSIMLTSTGGSDAFVAKLDGTTGQWLWATSAGAGTANGADERGGAIVADPLGGLLVTGSFGDFRLLAGPFTVYQTGTRANLFVARLEAATGAWSWLKAPGMAGVSGLAIDNQGNGYLTGSFQQASLALGSLTVANAWAPASTTQLFFTLQGFIARISAAGDWQWATALDSTPGRGTNPGSGGAYGIGLATDNQEHLYVSGAFSGYTATFGTTTFYNASTTYVGEQVGSVQMSDAFVARLSTTTGSWQWAVRAGGEDNEYFNQVSTQNGRVLVGGSFGRQGDMFMPGTPSLAGSNFGGTTLVSAGKYDIAVASLTDTGNWQWAVRAGGPGVDGTRGLAVDNSGRVLLAASSDVAAQFGGFSVAPSYSILARLAGGALPTLPASQVMPFALYPNPARTAVTLSGLPAHQSVQVFDMLGRLVLTARTPTQGPLELVLPPGLAPGVYVVWAAGQARQLLVSSTI